MTEDIEIPAETPDPEIVAKPASGRRRRRQAIVDSASTGPGEEWMLTYMDTVTLLVTLFVMILSFATFDPVRYNAFVEGMSLAKYGSGILMGTIGIRKKLSVEPVPAPAPAPKSEAFVEQPSQEQPTDQLESLRRQIDEQGLSDDVQLRMRQGTIEMEISENVLFPLASAELSESGRAVVAKLTGLLKGHEGTIAVEGHTDNLPIDTEQFPSNWELSGARASSVIRRLIEGGIASDKVRIVGYAETRPIADNGTAEGRHRNRRVNIILESPAAEGSR